MQTSVEPLEGNQVRLRVQVPAAEFEQSIDAAYRRFAQQVRIPGFRPGKAPRAVLERLIGPKAAISDDDGRRAFETDGLTAYRCKPLAVALPTSTEQVSKLLTYCHQHKIKVDVNESGATNKTAEHSNPLQESPTEVSANAAWIASRSTS